MPRRKKVLSDPEYYINRELSLLEFQRRVLEQALDPRTPLLERLRFLSISSTNLDEFYEIRVAGLKQRQAFGLTEPTVDGLTPREALKRISQRAHALVKEQYRVLNDVLLPALEGEGIRLLRRADWTRKQKRWLLSHFRAQVLPVLSPIGLDPAHPFPRILNKALTFAVSLDGTDAFGRESGVAVVRVPRSLPRLLHLPSTVSRNEHDFVLLSSIIHAGVEELFPGMTVDGCFQFRVTRNSDLFVDEEEVDDLLHALKGELDNRRYGDAVRLEVADTCPSEMAEFLLEQFDLAADDLFQCKGPVNLNRLTALISEVDRPGLKYSHHLPRPLAYASAGGIFEIIRREDILLHHPYDAFTPVVDFMREAAVDPSVVAIKQTLYRTSEDSPLVEALVEAARAGKEVTAIVEIKARFDEAANIDVATRLQDAGANVVYGIVGHKTHAKMLLVVRREGRKLQRYVHVGTGNYHPDTARIYTDVGLLTCDTAIAEDVQDLFGVLTGLQSTPRLRKLLYAPFTLHKQVLRLIDQERRNARKGKTARIIVKVNSLTEPQIIRALYRASQAGVPIDLIVRGICCLRPGLKGVSESITVRSIVGRFLEHSRVFYFYADGAEKTFISSADWMERNCFRRVEAGIPIENAELRARLIEECLMTYLDEGNRAWVLKSDGSYQLKKAEGRPRDAQTILRARFAAMRI